jgi:hypothetical protein
MSNQRHELRGDGLSSERILLARPMSVAVDWPYWLRSIERKRHPPGTTTRPPLAPDVASRATLTSFLLEGIEVSESDLDEARTPALRGRAFRSRARQRVRNHLAIQLAIERCLQRRQTLTSAQVVRWYTSISSGLSMTDLAMPGLERMDRIVRRINSPQMRLQPAIQEVAQLHADLLADAMFPSFNGILARLLLHVHLGHCGLPPVIFDPKLDPPRFAQGALLLPRLLELIDQALERW